MNNQLKLALAALLGFSAACSSVKNAPKQGSSDASGPSDEVVVRPYGAKDSLRHIVVMYGVRRPKGDSMRNVRLDPPKKVEAPAPKDSRTAVDPVLEKPLDD